MIGTRPLQEPCQAIRFALPLFRLLAGRFTAVGRHRESTAKGLSMAKARKKKELPTEAEPVEAATTTETEKQYNPATPIIEQLANSTRLDQSATDTNVDHKAHHEETTAAHDEVTYALKPHATPTDNHVTPPE